MKLSPQTIELLKNFSAINPNMSFKHGKVVSTVAEAKNIIATATIAEEIPQDFGIYDLTEFLSTLSLVDDPELEFSAESVTIREGKTSIRYFFAAQELLTPPAKTINMPKADVQVNLSADIIGKIKKASAVMGHPTFEIAGKKGKIMLNVLDQKNTSANKYSIQIDDDNACKETFSFIMVIGNLKMLPGDYLVSISSKLISHFKHAQVDLEYFIALEKTSTFGS